MFREYILQRKTRIAVSGVGVIAATTLGTSYYYNQGLVETLAVKDSMFADVICPEFLATPVSKFVWSTFVPDRLVYNYLSQT